MVQNTCKSCHTVIIFTNNNIIQYSNNTKYKTIKIIISIFFLIVFFNVFENRCDLIQLYFLEDKTDSISSIII